MLPFPIAPSHPSSAASAPSASSSPSSFAIICHIHSHFSVRSAVFCPRIYSNPVCAFTMVERGSTSAASARRPDSFCWYCCESVVEIGGQQPVRCWLPSFSQHERANTYRWGVPFHYNCYLKHCSIQLERGRSPQGLGRLCLLNPVPQKLLVEIQIAVLSRDAEPDSTVAVAATPNDEPTLQQ